MEERLIHFTLLGQEFSVYSDAPEEEVQQALMLLRAELEKTGLAAKGSTVPSSTMLVLGALQLASRCIHLEKEFTSLQAERKISMERKHSISGMIERITSVLKS
jgi:cell division protein ZapA